MSEEIKDILEEMRFKAGIYRDHKKRGLSFNNEEKNCTLLLEYIEQKENIIKEIRKDLDRQIEFCSSEANGTTNDKYCRIAINYLKHLKEILDKEDK